MTPGGIPGGGVPVPISDQKIVISYTLFQTWRRQELCYHYLD